MTKTKAVLETRGLTFLDLVTYPDLSITEGALTFVVGRSGSGKSTLLKLFNYTYTPTTGEVLYRGTSTHAMDTVALRRAVLLVSQVVFLFDGTIRDNFHRFYEAREQSPPADEVMSRYLAIAQVPFTLEDPCETMSGGERQRVYLAICLSFEPDVLMLDEPTSALDQTTSRQLFRELKSHAAGTGMTLITISHDQGLREEFADRVISVEQEAIHARHR